MADLDDFQMVKSKKRRCKRNSRKPFCTTDGTEMCQTVDKRLVMKRIEEKRLVLSDNKQFGCM